MKPRQPRQSPAGQSHQSRSASVTPVAQDAAELIAAHLARTSFADLPAATVAATKASILDTLACMLAGSASDDVAAIGGLVGEWGGRPVSTVVLGGGLKVPPIQAVLVNGAMVHQFDYDDTHDLAICHPTSASLPPALALAEAVGGVSGRDLIAAVALGSDLVCRVALAISGGLIDHPWFRAPVVGLFGATASAAKVLGASSEQHLEALGLALPLVSCTRASLHHGGSSVRSIRDGLVYRNGVLAAELAMRGVHGDKAVFDGPYGFYQVFFRGAYQREKLLDGLGERYETENSVAEAVAVTAHAAPDDHRGAGCHGGARSVVRTDRACRCAGGRGEPAVVPAVPHRPGAAASHRSAEQHAVRGGRRDPPSRREAAAVLRSGVGRRRGDPGGAEGALA